MGSTPQGPAGLPPTGQPQGLQVGEFTPSTSGAPLFGMGERALRGTPRVIVIPNPAAGADWKWALSGPSWYWLRGGIATLTCSAAVGNRTVALTLTVNGVKCLAFNTNLAQTANQIFQWNINGVQAFTSVGVYVSLPISDPTLLADGMTLGSETNGMQAGDQWSTISLYVEEFTDACIY